MGILTGYSTVWMKILQFFCHFNFKWNQFWLILEDQEKIATIWKDLNFGFCKKFHIWKCQKCPKIQNSELLKWSEWQFLRGATWPKLISRKIWNFHIGYSKLPRSVEMFFQISFSGRVEKIEIEFKSLKNFLEVPR